KNRSRKDRYAASLARSTSACAWKNSCMKSSTGCIAAADYSLSGKNSMLLDNSRVIWNQIFLPSIAERIAAQRAAVNLPRLLDQGGKSVFDSWGRKQRSSGKRVAHGVSRGFGY